MNFIKRIPKGDIVISDCLYMDLFLFLHGGNSMQLRCYHCHKPFALGKEMVHTALDRISNENLTHYDAQCPHCRRINHVSPAELMRAAPDWKKPEPVDEAKTE
jgi:hypothetical protein